MESRIFGEEDGFSAVFDEFLDGLADFGSHFAVGAVSFVFTGDLFAA